MRLVRKQELDRDFYSDKFIAESIKYEIEQKLKTERSKMTVNSDNNEPINLDNILYPELDI